MSALSEKSAFLMYEASECYVALSSIYVRSFLCFVQVKHGDGVVGKGTKLLNFSLAFVFVSTGRQIATARVIRQKLVSL